MWEICGIMWEICRKMKAAALSQRSVLKMTKSILIEIKTLKKTPSKNTNQKITIMKYKPQISKTAAKVLLLFHISKFCRQITDEMCVFFRICIANSRAHPRIFHTNIYKSAHPSQVPRGTPPKKCNLLLFSGLHLFVKTFLPRFCRHCVFIGFVVHFYTCTI